MFHPNFLNHILKMKEPKLNGITKNENLLKEYEIKFSLATTISKWHRDLMIGLITLTAASVSLIWEKQFNKEFVSIINLFIDVIILIWLADLRSQYKATIERINHLSHQLEIEGYHTNRRWIGKTLASFVLSSLIILSWVASLIMSFFS